MLKACVGLSLLSMVSGCEKPVAQSDLVGTYVANYAVANENSRCFQTASSRSK